MSLVQVDIADYYCCRVLGTSKEEAETQAGKEFKQRYPDATIMDWRCTLVSVVGLQCQYDVEVYFVDSTIVDESHVEQEIGLRYADGVCMSYREI